MDVDSIITNAKRLLDSETSALVVCWVSVAEEREALAESIRAAAGTAPLLACVVRDARFDDPNTLLQDLMVVLTANRHLLSDIEFTGRARQHGKVGVVLLARRELGIPLAASPVMLPPWFPVTPGEVHTTRIHDLTWHATVPLSAPEVQLSGIASLLFEFEGGLLRNLIAVKKGDHNLVSAFFDRIRRTGDTGETFDAVMASASAVRGQVSNPSGYRPSVRERSSLIARVWLLGNSVSSDQLATAGAALAEAVGITSPLVRPLKESFLSVLARPSSPDASQASRWGRNAIVTVRASCQLITAAAHSDAYPEFPLALLKASSMDLRFCLQEACEDLERAHGHA